MVEKKQSFAEGVGAIGQFLLLIGLAILCLQLLISAFKPKPTTYAPDAPREVPALSRISLEAWTWSHGDGSIEVRGRVRNTWGGDMTYWELEALGFDRSGLQVARGTTSGAALPAGQAESFTISMSDPGRDVAKVTLSPSQARVMF